MELPIECERADRSRIPGPVLVHLLDGDALGFRYNQGRSRSARESRQTTLLDPRGQFTTSNVLI